MKFSRQSRSQKIIDQKSNETKNLDDVIRMSNLSNQHASLNIEVIVPQLDGSEKKISKAISPESFEKKVITKYHNFINKNNLNYKAMLEKIKRDYNAFLSSLKTRKIIIRLPKNCRIRG